MDLYFDSLYTPLGTLIYEWDERGIAKLYFSEELPSERFRAPYFDLTNRIFSYFKGRSVNFSDIPLNTKELSAFMKVVIDRSLDIAYGETLSYSELAEQVKDSKCARAVGNALSKNPFPIIVPCHRVKAANGIGGFSAACGVGSKSFLLELESGQQYLC